MGKPSRAVYDAFCRRFDKINKEYGLNQFVVPYLISSHPGSTMKEAVELACAVRDMGYMPEQVQDFYPTPSTMSTCMYYTGVDPRTMEPIYVARDAHEKAMQRALIQYRKPENYKLVREALKRAGREDLIGYGKNCLIRPVPPKPRAYRPERSARAKAASKPRSASAPAAQKRLTPFNRRDPPRPAGATIAGRNSMETLKQVRKDDRVHRVPRDMDLRAQHHTAEIAPPKAARAPAAEDGARGRVRPCLMPAQKLPSTAQTGAAWGGNQLCEFWSCAYSVENDTAKTAVSFFLANRPFSERHA